MIVAAAIWFGALLLRQSAVGWSCPHLKHFSNCSELDRDQLKQRKLTPPHEVKQPDILLGIDVWHELQVQFIERLPSVQKWEKFSAELDEWK